MRDRLMTRTTQPKHTETRKSLRGTGVSAKGVFRFSVPYFLCVLALNVLVSPFARLVALYSSKSPLEAVNSEEIADNKRIGSEISQTNSNNPEQ
jgi:hypothetical protein